MRMNAIRSNRLPEKSRLHPFSPLRSEYRSSPRSPQARARATSPGRARPSRREGAWQLCQLLDGWSGLAAIKHHGPGVAKRPPRVGRVPRRRDRMTGQEQIPARHWRNSVFSSLSRLTAKTDRRRVAPTADLPPARRIAAIRRAGQPRPRVTPRYQATIRARSSGSMNDRLAGGMAWLTPACR